MVYYSKRRVKMAKKKSFVKGMKAEYRKIVWPSKDTVTKQTIAVLVSTIAVGVVITVLDLVIRLGLDVILG